MSIKIKVGYLGFNRSYYKVSNINQLKIHNMKSKRLYKCAVLLLVLTFAFNACSKDEVIPEKQPVDGSNNSNTNNDQTSTGGEITLYRVDNGDDIVKIKDYKVTGKDLEYQKDIAKHKELWNYVKKLIPKDHRTKIGEFLIMNGTKAKALGSVASLKDDLVSWQLALDADTAFGSGGIESLGYVIIHEFGHILTLNSTQLDPSVTNCTNYNPSEGCSKDNSYFNEFFKKYWNDIFDEFQALPDTDAASDQFYQKYKDRFVTNYASTNLTEDIAEVFASFITDDKPTGTTIANKKVLLFYDKPELLEFRNYSRLSLRVAGKKSTYNKVKYRKLLKNDFKAKCVHR